MKLDWIGLDHTALNALKIGARESKQPGLLDRCQASEV